MAPNPTASATASILDIRREELKDTLRDDIRKLLKAENGEEKQLPTLLLYDEQGLKLFEKITYLDEYYLTEAEIEVLENHADAIAERIAQGSQVIELGSGYDYMDPRAVKALCYLRSDSPSLTDTDTFQKSTQGQHLVEGT